MHSFSRIPPTGSVLVSIALCVVAATLRGATPLANPDGMTLKSLSAVADGGSARNINATFAGKPWVEYSILATSDFATWTPLGLAAESFVGEYLFHHSSAANQQF
jgi:hypothetical protein